MPKPTIRIHNIETGEVVDREMTNSEYKQYLDDQEKNAAEKQAEIDASIAKNALLAKLGISEEEAKLLLS